MGAYASNFHVDTEGAVGSFTSPQQANWVTAHAIATELAIPEVERLWVRFQQLGCDEDGLLSLTEPLPPQVAEDAFIRNILKTMSSVDGKVTFQSFLVSMKWIESESMDKKIRATFHLLNNGQPLDKTVLRKVLQKVYPEDSDIAVDRLTDVFFCEMDTRNKGVISEAEFVGWVRRMPQETIAELTEFHILPQDISLDAQEQLSEFRGSELMASGLGGVTPVLCRTPAISGTPSDEVLERVAEKICRRDWVLVGTRLGLLQQDLDYIISRFPQNPMQQAYHMLLDWKRKAGTEARTEMLDNTLRSSSMTDAALVLLP